MKVRTVLAVWGARRVVGVGVRTVVVGIALAALGANVVGVLTGGVTEQDGAPEVSAPGAVPASYRVGAATEADVRAFFRERPVDASASWLDAANTALADALFHRSRTIGATESWISWAAGHLYFPLGHTQDPARILRAGHGICSEAAEALRGMLQGVGVDSRIIRVGNTHIALEALTTDGWIYADPDYGFTVPVSATEVADHTSLLRDRMAAAGWGTDAIDTYVGFASGGRIDRLPLNQPMGQYVWLFERAATVAKWPLPMAMLVAVAVLRRRQRTSTEDDVPALGAVAATREWQVTVSRPEAPVPG